jgi:hypothetical protein
MHHLDDPAAGRAGASWNGQQLASVGSFGLAILEAGEDAVFV